MSTENGSSGSEVEGQEARAFRVGADQDFGAGVKAWKE
jgi:hypothetical protein